MNRTHRTISALLVLVAFGCAPSESVRGPSAGAGTGVVTPTATASTSALAGGNDAGAPVDAATTSAVVPPCPPTMPPTGTACPQAGQVCQVAVPCAKGGELTGSGKIECEGGVWSSKIYVPCIGPCSAAVAKSHDCKQDKYCYAAGECVHEGCFSNVWVTNETGGSKRWPCMLPPPPPPPPTAKSCAAEAQGEPELAHCKWTVGTSYYCGGAAPMKSQPMSWPTCICNGCSTSADCGPKGMCRSLPAYSCLSEAKVCVPAGDPCYGNGKQCVAGCSHDGRGKGGCLGKEPPRP